MKKITALLMAAMMIFCAPAAFAVELPEGVPSTLAAPTISNMELLKNEDGVPYFRMEITVPSSIIELDEARPTDGWVDVEMEGTYGEGSDQEPLADGGGLSVCENEENALT
nr:hypothetical protein [Sedimentibacter sp.]